MNDQEEISISVKLELEDYLEFNKAYMNMRLPWRIPFYIILFGGLIVYTVYTSWDLLAHPSRFLIMLAVPVIIPVLFILLSVFARKSKMKKVFESDSSLRKEHVYSFGKEGIKVKSPISEANYFWDDVFEVRESKQYFFVFVAINKAFIIPKKDLYDKNIIDQFRNIFTSNIRDPKKIRFS